MHHFQRLINRASLLLTAVVCLISVVRASDVDVKEYQIKAGFIYNFAKFITWPPDTFTDPHQPFIICTAGERLWEQTASETLKGKTIDERTILTRSVHNSKDIKNCQVLSIIGLEGSRLQDSLLNPGSIGVLTVTDANRNEKRERSGAVIAFVLDESRVRFVVDIKAAEKAGLTISSKLLSLALKVQQ